EQVDGDRAVRCGLVAGGDGCHPVGHLLELGAHARQLGQIRRAAHRPSLAQAVQEAVNEGRYRRSRRYHWRFPCSPVSTCAASPAPSPPSSPAPTRAATSRSPPCGRSSPRSASGATTPSGISLPASTAARWRSCASPAAISPPLWP